MPGGSPQGALLGVLLYLVYVSDIGMDHPDKPPADHGPIDLPSVRYPPPAALSNDEAQLKYVDDLSLAECVRLDTNLVSDGDTLVLPPERMHLQKHLDDICISAELHDM